MAEVASIGARVREQLWRRMARECEAMAQHALSTGRTIPCEVVEQLDQALSAPDAPAGSATPNPGRIDDVSRQKAAAGSALPLEMSPLASLSGAHGALAQIIAPATPEAVLLLADERSTHPLLYALGPLPISRQMLVLPYCRCSYFSASPCLKR